MLYTIGKNPYWEPLGQQPRKVIHFSRVARIIVVGCKYKLILAYYDRVVHFASRVRFYSNNFIFPGQK